MDNYRKIKKLRYIKGGNWQERRNKILAGDPAKIREALIDLYDEYQKVKKSKLAKVLS